jgi:uncharacterized membrane protein YhaH (DUF805 family)
MEYYTKVLKDYAVFSGRARRKEYWMFTLIHVLIMVALFLLMILGGENMTSVLMIVYALYTLAVLIPSLAVTIRRLHDTGKSGWWIFIGFIPFIGGFVLLYFMIVDSQPGANLYGPNPKEGEVTPPPAAVPPAPTPTV